jgi:hypothetical protein
MDTTMKQDREMAEDVRKGIVIGDASRLKDCSGWPSN